MGAQLSVKVKAKGKKAHDLVKTLAGMPDSSGSNYVSRNDLHVDAGASSGVSHSSERVPYKARPCLSGTVEQLTPELLGNEQSQVNKPETGAKVNLKPEGPGPSYPGEGIDTVKAVAREMNPVERARQENNRTRDMRTNLGRGKPAQPTVG